MSREATQLQDGYDAFKAQLCACRTNDHKKKKKKDTLRFSWQVKAEICARDPSAEKKKKGGGGGARALTF